MKTADVLKDSPKLSYVEEKMNVKLDRGLFSIFK